MRVTRASATTTEQARTKATAANALLIISRPPGGARIARARPIIRRVKTLLCLALLTAFPGSAFAQATLYEGARLIPGDGKPAIERSAFIVENGTITRLGRQGDVTPPAGAARVDLTGKTVMPTLIDIHTHAGFQKDATYRPENYGREAI